VNFEPSQDQEALLEAVKRFLSEQLPLSRLRLSNGEKAESYWSELAGLGLFGVAASSEQGGMGLDLADETLLFREFGRHLVSPCALATTIGRRLASLTGEPNLAARLMGGESRAALAFEYEPAYGKDAGVFALIDALRAEQILIVSRRQLSLVSRTAFSTRPSEEALDESILIEKGTLDPSASVLTCSDTRLKLDMATLTSAMMVGIAEEALNEAVDYAKERRQFGAAIGSFQSIKHMCADNAVRVDAAWSQTLWAALALREEATDAAKDTAAAAIVADDAARHAAQDNVQVHGGMGFTAECNAHRWVKRRHVLSRLLAHCIDAHAILVIEHKPEIPAELRKKV
jgi:alkylation response protein AidB-like acyl-CoA dehydrogenase